MQAVPPDYLAGSGQWEVLMTEWIESTSNAHVQGSIPGTGKFTSQSFPQYITNSSSKVVHVMC